MANARICDKCGKINTYTGVKDLNVWHYELTKVAAKSLEVASSFDLCEDCEKELLEWLNFKKEVDDDK